MSSTVNNSIKCIPVYQNQQDFFVGVFRIDQILKFTKYTKRLITSFDDEGIPIYNLHVQREIENPRVEKIADFLISDPNATFPTNIVLHLPSVIIENQEVSEDFVLIRFNDLVFSEIEKDKKAEGTGHVYISIIDGQHRIKGIEVALLRIDNEIKSMIQTYGELTLDKMGDEAYSRYQKIATRKRDLLKMSVVASFFIDKTLEYQAMIFSTINRTQKRVSDSLVYSLFGLTAEDSPQKSALQICLALNAHPKSPFYNRINLYGNNYGRGETPPLSQSMMVKSIINLICKNNRLAELDRFKKRNQLIDEHVSPTLPFRTYYAQNDDKKISNILYSYFHAIREEFTVNGVSLWDFNPETMKPSNILQTTVGYEALMRLLSDILSIAPEDKKSSIEYHKSILNGISKLVDVTNNTRYPFTSKSKKIFYLDLSLAVFPPKDDLDSRLVQLEELTS